MDTRNMDGALGGGGRMQIHAAAGAIRKDEVFSTVVIIAYFRQILCCNGFIHGRGVTESTPIFAQEAAILHAMRMYREWTLPQNQEMIQFANIKAGDAPVNFQIKGWSTKGQNALQSAAASGVIRDIQHMSEWLRTKTSLSPLRLPENYEGNGDSLTWHQEAFSRTAEFFRAALYPSQTEEWKNALLRIPMASEEVTVVAKGRHKGDELIALRRFANDGSEAAKWCLKR